MTLELYKTSTDPTPRGSKFQVIDAATEQTSSQ